MQIRAKFVVSLVSLLGAVACGDDDGGGSGVSSDKKVSDLSEAEARALCRSTTAKIDDINATSTQFYCVVSGLSQSQGDRSTCETLSEACQERMQDEDPVDCDSDDVDDGPLTDCDATVGELTACIDATKKQLDALKSTVNCSADLSELTELEDPETPAACTKIETKCPGFVEDME